MHARLPTFRFIAGVFTGFLKGLLDGIRAALTLPELRAYESNKAPIEFAYGMNQIR